MAHGIFHQRLKKHWGNLNLRRGGEILHRRPAAYQEIHGARKPVDVPVDAFHDLHALLTAEEVVDEEGDLLLRARRPLDAEDRPAPGQDARELADRLAPMKLRWWCEGRSDIMMRYSDDTFEALRKAGCTMIFFGAESGSNERLKEMNKDLRAEDTVALASRIRRFES